MKRARNRVELSVSEAANLDEALRSRKATGFCLPVSLRALGGQAYLFNVLSKGERMARLSTVEDYGLETGYFLDIFTQTSLDYLEAVLRELSIARIDETYRQFTGILLHISFQNELSKHNHYIALIPRQLLSGKTQKRLERTNSHLVVDTSGKPLVGSVKMTDLLEYINEMIRHGAGVGFMQIFKSTDD